jgi:hypothetical protein
MKEKGQSSARLSEELLKKLNKYRRARSANIDQDLSLDDVVQHLFDEVAPNEFPDKFQKEEREDT